MKKDFKFLSELLPKELKTKIYYKKQEEKILNYLTNIMIDSFKQHIKPIYINKKNIYCVVDNPIWANEFGLHKKHYLKELNNYYKKDFKNIICNFKPNYFKNDEVEKKHKEEIKLEENEKKIIEKDLEKIHINETFDKLAKNLLKTSYIKDKDKNENNS